jgi:hypothetical protein
VEVEKEVERERVVEVERERWSKIVIQEVRVR